MPERVQRRRTAGWTTPVDEQGRPAVYVGRGSRWGNPYAVKDGAILDTRTGGVIYSADDQADAHCVAVDWYRSWLCSQHELVAAAREMLAGRWLSCWCPEGMACHADVLLAVAAGEEP